MIDTSLDDLISKIKNKLNNGSSKRDISKEEQRAVVAVAPDNKSNQKSSGTTSYIDKLKQSPKVLLKALNDSSPYKKQHPSAIKGGLMK